MCVEYIREKGKQTEGREVLKEKEGDGKLMKL
jgi:hypothetical protein